MDKEKALEIICMIADGLNPYGHEVTNGDLPESNPITIMAICVAIVSLLSKTNKSYIESRY